MGAEKLSDSVTDMVGIKAEIKIYCYQIIGPAFR